MDYPLLISSYPHHTAFSRISPRFDETHRVLENINSRVTWSLLTLPRSDHVSDPKNDFSKSILSVPTVLHYPLPLTLSYLHCSKTQKYDSVKDHHHGTPCKCAKSVTSSTTPIPSVAHTQTPKRPLILSKNSNHHNTPFCRTYYPPVVWPAKNTQKTKKCSKKDTCLDLFGYLDTSLVYFIV